ncbi:MAG: ABC transporter ATP-binding protein [Brevundimonas sp.]|jgi:putative ABC transport system ATP-binding protein|uniref:ABC transporter ATP-binding protein n=1 Tax=Brevundimonas sp. TaxID=1871086 RepID=UPI0022C07EEA|nr:ABC transporter ATP-binding protein [Brevundimonas sp.]MCZ8087534.1 ABC transporter ATP-binding protein [Brevundimonas sp.]MCZ8193264.1 ABC transporter ATP-binding protein [Brevundimonas sp.]
MSAVIARHIDMAFGQNGLSTKVLFDVNLEVAQGELTMLVGPSGCGKTTLLSILSGTLRPTAGDVEVMGNVLTRMKDAEKVILRRRRIGFIFQQYNLLPALTGAENAAMALVADGMPLKAAAERARVVLETLGMGPHADKLPRQLSGGQQQRVAIARAIVHEPDLVVCDEPTAALDAETGRQVMELLKVAAAGPGRAVLVVTHDNRIYRYADRIVAMEDGRIVGDSRTDTLPEGLHAH